MYDIFIENKYTKWYFSIIRNALVRDREENIYYEKHHIVPKCIIKNDNIVLLTAKEHFVCHLLLPKMVPEQHKPKMYYAIKVMSEMKNQHQQRYTSRSYDYIKPKLAKLMSEERVGRPNKKLKNKKRPDWVKQKLKKSFSISQKHKDAAKNNLEKAIIAIKGIPRPEYLKEQWSRKHKLIKKSEETKQKFKTAALERSKKKCCCILCRKELPVNSLGSHRRRCN